MHAVASHTEQQFLSTKTPPFLVAFGGDACGRIPGVACSKQSNSYVLNGILKINDNLRGMKSIKVRRPDAPLMAVAVPDATSPNKRYIVQQLRKVSAAPYRNLSIVIDMSDALKPDVEPIKISSAAFPRS
ncbi:hypothetical protein KF913_23400 [Candidatus Obscuribacterales bacterium]|nr:hypothetical protein [Candidatus Obscuribacterales bacterium]